MKKLKVVLFIGSALLCFSATAYAAWQIQYDAKANRVLRLGGDTLRGNFATEDQCRDYWRSRPAFEQNHSKCVGYDKPSRQTQQDRRRGGSRFRDNNVRQRQQELREEAERQQRIRQQELREQQARAEFERGKKEMLGQLKGGSGGGLNLNGKGGRS